MSWLFLVQGVNYIRNFGIPISVQDKEQKEQFLSKTENFIIEESSISHGNHYSTSAYIYFI